MSTDTAVGNRGTPAEQPTHTKAPRRFWRILLTVVLVVIVICLVAGVVAYQLIFAARKSSEPYQVALKQAQQDKRLIEQIGEPIVDDEWFPVGRVSDHYADVRFNVSGPKGKATIHLEAERKEGKWWLKVLNGTPTVDDIVGHTIAIDRGEAGGSEAPPFVPNKEQSQPPEKGKKTEPPPKIDLTVPDM